MENQLEIIKSNLPSYKAKVLTIATRMAKEALEASKGVSKAAAELETLQNGTTSEQ